MNDWEDRLLDASLHEVHGQRPPDLSSRVVSALQREPLDPASLVVTGRRAGPRWLAPWLLVAAAALLVVALAFVARRAVEGRAPGAEPVVTARLEIVVLQGELDCIEFGGGDVDGSEAGARRSPPRAASHHAAGSVASFAARPGNRLRCAASCQAQVGPFGIVEGGPLTELEVKSMEFTWKNGAVAASTLTVAVVAGVVTWHGLLRSETAAAGETLRLQAPPEGGDGATLVAENDRLRKRLAQLEQENAALRLEPERDRVVNEAVEPPPPPPPETAASSMVFTDEAYAKALAGVDWKTMGSVTNEMGPLLAQLVEAMKNGEELPPDLGVKIQELNMKLVAQVPALLKSGLPGFGPNGSYTHPLVVANVLANTLAAAGQPLTAAQQAKIDGLVRAFSVENQSIAAGPREFAVENLLAEVEMKDRFYAELASQLAPEQSDTMHPKGSMGYDGANLFSTGLMTRPYSEGVAAGNATEFARVASNRLGEDLGLDEAGAAKVRAVVERVTAAAPELWRDPVDAAERNLKMWKSGRATAALRRQVELMREIQRQVPMTPEQLKKFRSLKGVLVPLPK